MKWLRQNWLYILAVALPFERIPSYDLSIFGFSITLKASFILALVIILAAVVHLARVRRYALSWPDRWLMFYGLVMVASTGIALSRGRSLQVIFATTLVLAVAVIIENTAQQFSLSKLYTALLGTAVFGGIFGMYQFFGDSLGLSTHWTGLREIYTKAVFGFPRIQSFSLEPLFYASFLLIPLMLLVAHVYARRSRPVSYVLIWFLTTLLALTLSRGGIYASIGGLILIFVLLFKDGSWRRFGLIFITAAIAVGSALGLVASVSVHSGTKGPSATSSYLTHATTVTSNTGSADSDRSVNRRLAIQAFKSEPIIGIGIGNFGYYAQGHDPRYTNNPRAVVNNEYLEVLAETGLLGMLALAGFAVSLIWRVYRSWSTLEFESRIWVAGLSAVLFGVAIQFYAVSTLYIIHIWFVVGLLLALTRRKTDSSQPSTS